MISSDDLVHIHLRHLLAQLHSRAPRETIELDGYNAAALEVAKTDRCDVLATLQKLPPLCLARSRTSGAVIVIRRGELGFSLVQTTIAPEQFNATHGITVDQVEAMQNGARYGWEVPIADPDVVRALRTTPMPTCGGAALAQVGSVM